MLEAQRNAHDTAEKGYTLRQILCAANYDQLSCFTCIKNADWVFP